MKLLGIAGVGVSLAGLVGFTVYALAHPEVTVTLWMIAIICLFITLSLVRRWL